jgi:type VI secretion system protein ImpI
MFLTFEVISANASAPGVARRKVFTVDGGRIGRSPENDMVLPGVGVHRHHATVRFINGVFFVEGVGTNGIAINDPERVLPRNEPYPLKSGDRVFIDEYEVVVTASASVPVEQVPRTVVKDPVREMPPAASVPPAAPPSFARSSAPAIGGVGESAEDLDPLRKLGSPQDVRAQRPAASSWNHTPSLSDHFTPPAVPPSSGAGGSVIPENWDRTSFDRSKLQPSARGPAAPAAPSNGAAGSNGAPGSMAAASLPAELDKIMRVVVQGLIEVLRARSEIKTEFRMPVTQVKVSENNPLKFAANADDAIGKLLGKRNSAYLAPQEAFEDAFNDVRFHQLAMLAGVRAGFDNLMSRFDPAQLQDSFERQGKRGGLFGGGKATYWERYAERYNELTADRDETFRRLFGEEFARAYEQQLSVLKRSRGEKP